MLRKPKVVFHPGKRLQEMRDVAKFARMAQKAAACKPSPVMIPASPKSSQLDQLLPGSRFVFISMPTQSDTSDIQLTFFSYTTCLLQHHVYDYKKQSVHLSCLMRTY